MRELTGIPICCRCRGSSMSCRSGWSTRSTPTSARSRAMGRCIVHLLHPSSSLQWVCQ